MISGSVNRDYGSDNVIQHQIANKYYSALLTILLKDFSSNSLGDVDAIEGYILVPSNDKVLNEYIGC